MTRRVAVAIAAAIVVGGVLTVVLRGGASYENPVFDHDAPDPAVLRDDDGTFYAYTTQSIYGARLLNIPVLRSADLVHWRFVADALPSVPGWAVLDERDSWAPHVIRVGETYVMYFSEARAEDGTMAIGVATSDRPEGPFRDALGEPLLTGPTFTTIDPFVMKHDGDLWIYWGSAGDPFRAQQLSEDGLTLVGEPRTVFSREFGEPYEGLIEGPWLERRGGWWYLMYSGDACCDQEAHYAVNVARSRSPFGPFQRGPDNPILEADDTFNAPGHHSLVTDDAGDDWILYHAYLRPDSTFRVMLLDRIEWVDGWPVLEDGTPTSDPQPVPEIDVSSS